MEAELALLDSFAGKRVLVVGDGCTDIDIEVEPRNNPEGDWPCWIERLVDARGGMADAVAVMAKKLGAAVTRETETRYVVRRYWHDGCAVARFDRAERPAMRLSWNVTGMDAVIISDYAKGALNDHNTRKIIAAANAAGVPVLVDPARGVAWSRYAGATVIKANQEEAAGVRNNGLSTFDWLVMTDGEEGMSLHGGNGNLFHQWIKTTPRAGDCTGCGDIAAAVLGLTLAARGDLATGCRLANIAAGLKMAKRGAQPVSADEIRAALSVCASSR